MKKEESIEKWKHESVYTTKNLISLFLFIIKTLFFCNNGILIVASCWQTRPNCYYFHFQRRFVLKSTQVIVHNLTEDKTVVAVWSKCPLRGAIDFPNMLYLHLAFYMDQNLLGFFTLWLMKLGVYDIAIGADALWGILNSFRSRLEDMVDHHKNTK